MTTQRKTLGLTIALAVIGVFVTYVPITSVSVALATIRQGTHAGTSDLQWVTDAYIIPMAAAILSAGVFGDLHGRRKVYVVGMALTVVGATIAALANTATGASALHVLWAGQAVSGLGAGLLLPTTLALIAHAVPDLHDRAKYVALWATGLVLGLSVGPLVSGVILEHAGWGWIFAPVAVLALVTGALAQRVLPESRAPEGRRLDWSGQALATVAIVASIFGVIEGGDRGWADPATVGALVLGAAALAAFVAVELRTPAPLLDVRLFRSPAFAASGFAALVALFAIVGTLFLLSIFFGADQHLKPLDIGYRLLFINLVTALASPFVGRAMRRVHPIGALAFGLGLGAVAMLLLRGLGDDASFGAVTWRLSVLGIADAFMLSAVAVAAIHAVPHHLAGMASAANTALRQYGGALGPAVLGVILTSRMAGGATMAAAMHVALVVNAIALAAAALVCLAAWRSVAQPVDDLERQADLEPVAL
ncbi:MFS transporter [Conexibacter woesei]|uniref:MFS transporter n=1 Tax=Conexibacter woesei TaxID=191495 RepID=UPI0009DC2B32|nr:MFS transporter [Conexibacter woesei]